MYTNLLWEGKAYHSLENCMVATTEAGLEINSVIIGMADGKIYKVEYRIKTDVNWSLFYAEVKIQLPRTVSSVVVTKDDKGSWEMNGQSAPEFDKCTDIDISLSPFTNTLPINRLRLPVNEKQHIRVVYFDILNERTKPVFQNYTKLSATEYKYENVPNDFQAIIQVDESGFIYNYPELFTRVAKQENFFTGADA